jgi:hypothetical protein
MFEGQPRVQVERPKVGRVFVRTGSWRAWLDLALAAAVLALPLCRGHSAALVLPAAGMIAVVAAWRLLSDAEVAFDRDGIRVSDRYWRLLGREPILFRYAEGILIVAQSGLGFGVLWVNGLRIAAGSRAAEARLEKAAGNMGLRFMRVGASFETALPTTLILAAIPCLFLFPGLSAWLLYYGSYGAGLLAVLIQFVQAHRAWGAIAARQRTL